MALPTVPVAPSEADALDDIRRQEMRFFRTAVACEFVLVIIIAAVSVLIWNRTYYIMFVPVSILEWGFVGGVTGVLFRVAYPQNAAAVPVRFTTWVVAKPVVGMVMGGLVYFLAVSGQMALNGGRGVGSNELLNVIAFFGGFSDRFGIELINKVTGGDRSR